MIGDDINEIIKEYFVSMLCSYQINLEESMKDSEFVFGYVDGLHCKCK